MLLFSFTKNHFQLKKFNEKKIIFNNDIVKIKILFCNPFLCRTVEKIRLQNITEDCSLQAEYCYTTYRTEVYRENQKNMKSENNF